MNQTIVREDPSKISSTLKEAVVDSILNLTYAQLSGQGPTGQYLFGARPRALLNSGFLLPQRNPSGDDEVTSPIWISSHGLQMQLNATSNSVITVHPQLSLYVRVLPHEEDLKRPDCRPVFMLRQAVIDELKAERDKRLDQEWEKARGTYASKWKHPGWLEIRQKVVDEVYAAKGIPRHLLTSDLPQEATETEASRETEGDESGDTVKEAFPVATTGIPPIKDEHFEPLAVPHKWMRLEIELPVLEIDTSKSSTQLQGDADEHALRMNDAIVRRLNEWINSDEPGTGGMRWGYRRQLSIPASQYTNWSDFLDRVRNSGLPLAVPNIQLGWDLQFNTDWLDSSKCNLFLALENVSPAPRQHVDETEESVFLVSLRTQLPAASHHSLKLERIKPSYRFNKYLTYPAMGHNCGVIRLESKPELAVLQTTWTPRYIQPRIVPTSANGVQRKVRLLAQPEGLEGIEPLVPAMQTWLDSLPREVNLREGLDASDSEGIAREMEALQSDFTKWAAEINSIATGLECLQESKSVWQKRGQQSDPKAFVYEAWLAMNEAMADFMQSRFKHDNNEWRLFQLAFIIANIPALASRIEEFRHFYDERRDDAVTLLYFATGGGKSEAFFGLLVFNLMLDRLRGKRRGVTALIRYPLRLLTIQQAQRCARVLAWAERVRRRYEYAGDRLSIGFWVGSGGSPNRHNAKGVKSIPQITAAPPSLADEEELRESDTKYSAALRAWRKLPKCPFCQKETALRLFVEGNQTLGHVCTDIKCDSNQGQWRPLPFYIVDEDIYDLAPSVLLGTVDKLALIGHSSRTIRRIYGMFGAAPWVKPINGRLYIPDNKELALGPDSKGMEGVYPAYKSGQRIFHDPFPSLIIQDEAHLLDESLGTFAGLFESTLDAVFEYLGKPLREIIAVDPQGQRRRAKIIAASATVSDPERQLEHLYQRSIPATQFPEPGPSLYKSFYAEPAEAAVEEVARRANPNIEVASQQARVYTAFMTNGKPHTSTSVAVLSGFHLTITRLFDSLVTGDDHQLKVVQQQLADNISSGPIQELHKKNLLAASASELITLVDLHRIALTYVTNKKGGDQIMAAEAEETRKRHLNEGIELAGIDTRLITGSVEQGEIQAVVDTAQLRVNPGQPLPPIREQLRSVIATSAISHGVDVDEFNSMFFAGMPSDIAEYIQASSRVGRMHIGFVVLLPTPQRRRDRHIVHVFDIFHRFLERMVQPAAIDRWAERAIERVFPSLFQAYMLGVLPSQELLNLPENEKQKAPDFTVIPNVRRELSARGNAFIEEINRFIELAVGLRGGFAPEGENYYRRRIDQRTRRLIMDTWSSPLWGSGTMDGYFKGQTDLLLKPMTSLRDVDQGGIIQVSSRDAEGRKQLSGEVQGVMDLIRHGVANNDGTDNSQTGD